MRKRKVVEDSDEEDDEPRSSPLPAPSVLKDLSPGDVVDSNSVQTIGPSTASAGMLHVPQAPLMS